MTGLTVEIALHLACLAGVFAVALALCLPMLEKPLSEDEGNWFYYAVFADQGERMHGAYSAFGFFNLPLAARLAARAFGRTDARFLQWFKVVWYGATVASAYGLAFALFGDRFAAVAAGVCLAVVMGCGSTLFMLSYAEHYSILWMNLAALCALGGLDSGSVVLCAGAGLFSGLAVQFKPTGLLFAVALPALFLAHDAPLAALAAYAAPWLALQLAPVAILRAQGLKTTAYVRDTLRAPLVDGFAAAARLCGLGGLSQKLSGQMSAYVSNRHESARNNDRAQLRANMAPCLADLRLLVVLAVGRASFGAVRLSFAELFLAGLFVLHVLAQQVQKNYYTPHFNPIWTPLAILAGASLPECLGIAAAGGPGGWAVGALLAFEAGRLALILRREWLPGAGLRFGFLHPVVGMIFDMGRVAGEAIRVMSREGDRLCVWGDQPSVYLYARRRSFRAKEMFFYGHHRRLTRELWILESLREHPPEYILFFNWRVADSWDMARVAEHIGHRYALVTSFDLRTGDGALMAGPQGKTCSFPLYRRDDAHYEQAMLERAESCGGGGAAEALLRELLLGVPDSFEARFRLDSLTRGDDARAVRKLAAKLLAADPPQADGAALHLALARVARELGDAALAERELNLVAPDAPCRARALVLSGALLFEGGRRSAAMQAYQQAVQLRPYSPGALNGMGECLLAAGNREDAQAFFERALSFMSAHEAAARNLDALLGGPQRRVELFRRLGVRGYWKDGDPVCFS